MTGAHSITLPNGVVVEFKPVASGGVDLWVSAKGAKPWRSGGPLSEQAALAIYVELGKFLGRLPGGDE